MAYRFAPTFQHRASWAVRPVPDMNPSWEKMKGDWMQYNWSGKLDRFGRQHESVLPGVNAPLYFQTYKVKQPSDIFAGGSCVSKKFKILVESFEPGVHEFHRIHLLNERKQEWLGEFYIMRVRQFLAAVMVKESGLKWTKTNDNDYYIDGSMPNPKLILNKRVILVHSLWRPKLLGSSAQLFCSNEFYKACRDQNLKYIRWLKCSESDEPWTPEGNEYPARDDPVRSFTANTYKLT
jgi:hypothetical protein